MENSKQNSKKITLVVPFYNESESISSFHNTIVKVLNEIHIKDYEIVCVDDGSSDDTLEKLIRISKENARFIVIELSRNFGKEAALTAGIDAATGDAVIPIDADLQDPPELISQMVEKWIDGAEVVLARRVNRQSDTYLKRKTAEIFYSFHNRLSDVNLPHNVGDFRLMDRSVIDAIKRLPERQRFMKGLFAWVGFRTVTIDYERKPRVAGYTKFSGWKLWNFALEGITGYSSMPLKIWTYIGGLGALLTLIYAVWIVIKTLIYGVDVPGYASLLVAVLLMGSLQLISLGIIGEYIGRTYMESKNRPLYLIRKKYGGKA